MDLLTLLKSLRSIEPDEEYTRRSRERIVGVPRRPFWRLVRATLPAAYHLRRGPAFAFATILLMITGSILSYKLISLLRPSVFDQAVLYAEAQAVETQMELATVAYSEATQVDSSPKLHLPKASKTPSHASPSKAARSKDEGVIPAETTLPALPPSLSIDEVLEMLAQ